MDPLSLYLLKMAYKRGTMKITADDNIVLNRKYTYDNFMNDVKRLKGKYKELLHLEFLGKSHDDRDIVLLRLGRGDTKIICTAGVHARENINTIVVMKIIETYCSAFYSKSLVNGLDVNKILNESTIYFVPLVNPDGYSLTVEGIESIKNSELRKRISKQSKYIPEWKSNARGVDINRNFPAKYWGKIDNKHSKGNTNSFNYENYCGPFPMSEYETKALIRLFNKINFYGYMDIHSRGKSIYYYRNTMNDEYNKLQNEILSSLTKASRYSPVQPNATIELDGNWGNTVHYVSESLDKPAFTVETVFEGAKNPLSVNYQLPTYNEIKALPLIMAEKAINLKESNYYKYKVYVDNIMIKDFRNKDIAKDFSSKFKGSFVTTDIIPPKSVIKVDTEL